MSIEVKHDSTYQRDNLWEWAIWVEGIDGDLDRIEHVVYTLHPTFPNPVQRVTDPTSNFRLTGSGWGEFMIYVSIGWKDGRTEQRQHWLALERPSNDDDSTAADNAPASLFLSSGVADQPFADALSSALQAEGIQVFTADEVPDSEPLDASRSSAVSRANQVVFIVSDKRSPWLARQVEEAKSQGTPITGVMVGDAAQYPAQLIQDAGGRLMKVAGQTDIMSTAREVAEQIKHNL